MAVGYTYKLEHFQTIPGASNPSLNRYYYQHVSGGGLGATNLALAFIEHVLPAVQAIQTEDTISTMLRVTTVDDENDFIDYALVDSNGAYSGEALPPFVTAAFILHRPFLSFRSGRKAIGGIPEAIQSGGTLAAGFVSLVAAISTAMAEVIAPDGVSEDFAPVLVKNYTSPPPTREVAQITAVSFKRIGSQNTRK